MRQLLIIPVLFLTVMFSSPSYAKWEKVAEDVDGNTYYVDFDRMRKVNGYVYYWWMDNLLDNNPFLSSKFYRQGDCKLFRFKTLTASYYKEPMGGGTSKTITPKNPGWEYPSPGSISEDLLTVACSK